MIDRFSYARAESSAHAVALLNEPGVRGRVLAGGTDLVLLMKEERDLCDRIVDVTLTPELHEIRRVGDVVTIGAAASFSEIIDSPVVRETAALLVEACHSVGAPQIRNMGTLGGMSRMRPHAPTLCPRWSAWMQPHTRSLPRARLSGPSRTW